ncbi:MAG: hypothetical protein ABIH23_30730 [bacterium]
MTATSLIGQIVKILDDQRLVANRGSADGWAKGDLMVVYEEGEEIQDPTTGQSLGNLELVKAEVEAVHVQDRLTFLMPRGASAGEQPHTVLSAVLTHTPSGDLPGSPSPDRGRLLVKRDQVSGRPSASPIGIGDLVRKI